MNNTSNLKLKDAATSIQKTAFTKEELIALAKMIQQSKVRAGGTKAHHGDFFGVGAYHR